MCNEALKAFDGNITTVVSGDDNLSLAIKKIDSRDWHGELMDLDTGDEGPVATERRRKCRGHSTKKSAE